MTSPLNPILAPPLRSGLYIGLISGHTRRWHTAATPEAGRTDCGIAFPEPGRAKDYSVPPTIVGLDAVCRRCAGRHLELATGLGLIAVGP